MPLGWFTYTANRDGAGQVVQLGARPGAYARVLAHLWRDAWSRGVVALEGRVDAASMHALAAEGCNIHGGWSVHLRALAARGT